MADTLELSPVAPPPARRRVRMRLLGVAVALVVAGGLLLTQGLLSNLNYFETVGQVLAHRASVGTTVIRLEGVVKARSIERTASGASFVLVGSGHEVHVAVSGSPPQLFAANIPVVVVGRFTTATSMEFAGTQIIVKHSASYIAQHPTRVRAPNGTTR